MSAGAAISKADGLRFRRLCLMTLDGIWHYVDALLPEGDPPAVLARPLEGRPLEVRVYELASASVQCAAYREGATRWAEPGDLILYGDRVLTPTPPPPPKKKWQPRR